jgi:hypothetical protein
MARVAYRVMVDYLLFAFVWITPLFLAAVIWMQLRRVLSGRARAGLWLAYLVWAAVWVYLWMKFIPRSAALTTQERIYLIGVLVTAALGIVIMLSGEVRRWNDRKGHHYVEEDCNPR